MKKVINFSSVIFHFSFIVAIAMTTMSCAATKKAPTEAELAQQQFIGTMLSAKMYKVDFTTAFPQAGRAFPLAYPYFVSVIGNRVESFLPYFGRAYTIPYGGGEGLRFEAPIEDYTVEQGKKGQWQIRFSARTDEDSYTFNLEIYPSGESYLSITAINKQGMSFSGNVDLDPEFETVIVE